MKGKLAVLLAAMAGLGGAYAQADLLLDAPGIPGNSQHPVFMDHIEVDNYRLVGAAPAGRPTRPRFDALSMELNGGTWSSELLRRHFDGSVIPSVTLRTTVSMEPEAVLTITLSNVRVTSFRSVAVEEHVKSHVSLSFDGIVLRYLPQDPTTGTFGDPIETEYAP